jgi:hypothetical protein
MTSEGKAAHRLSTKSMPPKIVTMTVALSPIESEFSTQNEAEDYDLWFRAQVHASLDDPRPCIAHDQAMAELDSLIEAAQARLTALTA